jgi:hypothetical protein
MTSNTKKVCVCSKCQNNNNAEIKKHNIFVNEVKTQYEKNHSGAAKPRISTIQKTSLVTQ